MLLTFKIKLNLSNSQKEIINHLSNEGRLLYNYFLNQKVEFYKTESKYLSYFIQQKKLKNYKTQLLTYDSKKEILRTLDNNYKSFFSLLKTNKDKNPKLPKFRGENYFFTLSFTQDFIIKNNQLIISYLGLKKLRINLDYLFPIQNCICLRNKTKESQIKQLKIYKKEDSYYASIVYEKPERVNITNRIISTDLGKKNLATLYDKDNKKGIIYNSKFLSENQKYYDKRVDELKSKRDKKVKGSIKSKKLNTKIKQLNSKKKTQTSLTLHKLSKDIVNLNANLVIGELTNLKQNTKTKIKGINRQMQGNWNLMTFINLLEYKQILKGNKLIKVNEAWTSKTCSNCGSINHGLSLGDREYVCPDCGLTINRDLNGAINILKVYMGDYNTPLETLSVSERFSWSNTKKMNKRLYLKKITN